LGWRKKGGRKKRLETWLGGKSQGEGSGPTTTGKKLLRQKDVWEKKIERMEGGQDFKDIH